MVGGWDELYPIFCVDFWNFFNFAKPLSGSPHPTQWAIVQDKLEPYDPYPRPLDNANS